MNVNIEKRVADILSKHSYGMRAMIKIDKACQSISIQFSIYSIVSLYLIEKSMLIL